MGTRGAQDATWGPHCGWDVTLCAQTPVRRLLRGARMVLSSLLCVESCLDAGGGRNAGKCALHPPLFLTHSSTVNLATHLTDGGGCRGAGPDPGLPPCVKPVFAYQTSRVLH